MDTIIKITKILLRAKLCDLQIFLLTINSCYIVYSKYSYKYNVDIDKYSNILVKEIATYSMMTFLLASSKVHNSFIVNVCP